MEVSVHSCKNLRAILNFQKFFKMCLYETRLLPNERGDACLLFGSIFAANGAISKKIRVCKLKKARIEG